MPTVNYATQTPEFKIRHFKNSCSSAQFYQISNSWNIHPTQILHVTVEDTNTARVRLTMTEITEIKELIDRRKIYVLWPHTRPLTWCHPDAVGDITPAAATFWLCHLELISYQSVLDGVTCDTHQRVPHNYLLLLNRITCQYRVS